MRLSELDPELIRWEDRPLRAGEAEAYGVVNGDATRIHTFVPKVETLAEAQGIEFDCPVCGQTRPDSHSHRVQVAFRDRGVLEHQGSRASDGKPSRWAVSGTGIDDLTLQPSVDCTHSDPGCWHGFVTAGMVT